MSDKLAIQFRIRFQPHENPPGRVQLFTDALRDQAILGSGLACYFGGLGGGACAYGVIWSEAKPITLADRDHIAAWIRQQPIACRVELGSLEPIDGTDITREVDEYVFSVDNLTDDDRQAAAQREQTLQAKLDAFRKRRADAATKPSAADMNFCGVAIPAGQYDEAFALRAFVARHCRHLMTPLERRVTEYTAPLTSDATSAKVRRLHAMCEERDGHVEDEDVLAAFSEPMEVRKQNAVERVIREHYDELPLNRCPVCDRLARTPTARQCLWCGHDWH